MAGLKTSRVVHLLLAAALVSACVDPVPDPGLDRGAALFDTCAPCHGPEGGGNQALGAPAIAGMPQWYVERQLNSFKNNWRGAHPSDTVGIRMKSMVLTLDLEGDLESVAEYVASMPATLPDDVLDGDAVAGRSGYAGCIACHGTDGSGNEQLGAPPLVGLSDWYLLRQLEKFKAGWRGAHSEDLIGQTMRMTSGVMQFDEAAMHNVVAYIETLR